MKHSPPVLNQILGILTGTFLIAAYPLAEYGRKDVLIAVVAGATLGTMNILMGVASIDRAFRKPMTAFTASLIGGMGIRLLVLLTALTVLIAWAKVNVYALTFSLLYFYAVYLVAEIVYIQKKFQTTHDSGIGA